MVSNSVCSQKGTCCVWLFDDAWHREIMKGLLLHKLGFAEQVSGMLSCSADESFITTVVVMVPRSVTVMTALPVYRSPV